MVLKRGLGVIVILFFIGLVSASFQVGNLSHSIETEYNPSEKIFGWINLSLSEEPTNSLLVDSNNNSMTLLDWIEKNENFEYSCNIKGCTSDYALNGEGKSTMSFTLLPKQRELIGVSLKGEIKSINFLGFTISSDVGPSCYSQIGINVLNDQSREYINEHASSLEESLCENLLDKGCFNASKISEQYSIGKFPYKHCQKLTLFSSPGFRVGAWINNQTSDTRNITMALYNLNLEEIEGAACKLPSVIGSGNVSCKINYSVEEDNPYLVCTYSDKIGSAKVRGYSDRTSGCGFYQESELSPDETAAFDIFAQGLGFGPFQEMTISDSSEENLGKIKDYIFNRYGSYDCIGNNCIIPILINSEEAQNANIKNLRVEYTTSLGGKVEEKIYSIVEIPSKISSGFGQLSLDYGNFAASSEYGEELFALKLNNKEIFSEKIYIRNFPKITSIYPKNTTSLIPALFTVFVSSGKNITEYLWDFNDSTPIQKTTLNRIAHVYNNSKVYKVKINVTDTEGLSSSNEFEISVIIHPEQIGEEIKKRVDALERVKAQIGVFDSFIQESLTSVLGIKKLEDKLKFLQKEHALASTEEDYSEIIGNLSTLEIPDSVDLTKKSPLLPFFPERQEINLEILKEIGGGVYPSEQENEYRDAVLSWQVENIDLKVSIEEFSKIGVSGQIPVMNKMVIEIERNYSGKPSYLFVKKMEGLKFSEKTFEKENKDYFYWILDSESKKIEFSTSEIIDYEELPIFVAPELSLISVESTEISPLKENLKAKWMAISFSLGVLFFIAMIVYSLLSVWYKRKYEEYLFKNRNDLYNLISYVNASKKKGIKEWAMKGNLKRSGWTGEQVAYVLKKYSGRRTGMVELPLTKFIDKLIGSNNKTKQIPPSRENFPRRPF
jgi:PKD repeat protein